MKILFVSITVPHAKAPTAGGIETYRYIKGVSERHEVDLVSALAEGDEEKFKEMSSICKGVYSARRSVTRAQKLRQIGSWLLGLCRGPLFHRQTILLANKLIQRNNYDVVQVEFAEAGLHIRRAGNTKMVLDTIDVGLKPALRRFAQERNPARKILLLIRVWLTRWFEPRSYKNFDLVLTRSEYDMALVKKYYSGARAAVLPHLVDTTKIPSIAETEKTKHSIVFTGAFQRELNLESARFLYERIFPLVRKACADARVIFAGGNPPPEMLQWAKQDTAVTVTGFVDNLFEYYPKSTVFAAPMFIGGGVITKIIEAMFCGCPVVTTSIGNEGIGAENERDILLAESAAEFAEKILYLFNNDSARDRISENARQFVQQRYDMDRVIALLEKYYTDLVSEE
jgi:glycosyltransferase involved in cell wall biosynthesis